MAIFEKAKLIVDVEIKKKMKSGTQPHPSQFNLESRIVCRIPLKPHSL